MLSSQVQNETVFFNEIPDGLPVAGKTLKKETSNIDLSAALSPGSVLLKTIVLSLDPYLRGRMRPVEVKSYSEAYPLHKPITNFGVSEVIASENKSYKKGDKIYSVLTEFGKYWIADEETAKSFTVLENKEKLPWSYWVGALGMPGSTAWFGLHNIVKPKKGETIFISAGSGAVGQMVIALAKNAGMKVIASAGSDEKVEFMKSIGADVAFNYKTQNTEEVLKKHPFEVFWDNVGGETLDAALATIKERGRIVVCGIISGYNGEDVVVKNTLSILTKMLTVQGFIIIHEDITGFYDEVPALMVEGKIQPPKENIIKGLDNGESFINLLTGDNFGKAVISLE